MVWVAIIGVGAVLGAFLRVAVVVWVLLGMLAFAFVGGFAAVSLKLFQGEWLLLLIGAPVVGAGIFVAAAISNALIGPKEKPNPKLDRQ